MYMYKFKLLNSYTIVSYNQENACNLQCYFFFEFQEVNSYLVLTLLKTQYLNIHHGNSLISCLGLKKIQIKLFIYFLQKNVSKFIKISEKLTSKNKETHFLSLPM